MGKEQCAYRKQEGHWKAGYPGLKHKKENNKRKMGASRVVEREEHSE